MWVGRRNKSRKSKLETESENRRGDLPAILLLGMSFRAPLYALGQIGRIQRLVAPREDQLDQFDFVTMIVRTE